MFERDVHVTNTLRSPPVSWASSGEVIGLGDGDKVRRVVVEGFDDGLQPSYVDPLQRPLVVLVDAGCFVIIRSFLLFHLLTEVVAQREDEVTRLRAPSPSLKLRLTWLHNHSDCTQRTISFHMACKS